MWAANTAGPAAARALRGHPAERAWDANPGGRVFSSRHHLLAVPRRRHRCTAHLNWLWRELGIISERVTSASITRGRLRNHRPTEDRCCPLGALQKRHPQHTTRDSCCCCGTHGKTARGQVARNVNEPASGGVYPTHCNIIIVSWRIAIFVNTEPRLKHCCVLPVHTIIIIIIRYYYNLSAMVSMAYTTVKAAVVLQYIPI